MRCGQAAALALDELISHRPVACEPKDKDRYGRIVAICKLGTTDLNGWMVMQGHALAYRTYAKDYVPQEAEARRARRGVWAGSFDYPWDWRRGKRSAQPEAAPVQTVTAGDCPIKGNITAKGQKIYHTPASPWYDRTGINTSKGERWFCTEQEAQAAGWRPAQY
ncbi:thermonuclease family protein [Pedomonas mirosovicensis]|uniref:thermonuclease family protein n=1 Tax=Pedomonas mirosovicensis TaxID=2908641 RepID=UPI0021685204|nr:thermonuclease family protein [Pedomonas mirosovicensis]MCH8686301.1 thermonuclease family protein [Pedomonas mirosovicensis]